jgi:exopolysaccharide biosynthesis polyprenyl glycosylphosphotransferase
VARLIHERKYLHSHILGYLSDEKDVLRYDDIPHLGTVDQLLSVVEREAIDHVIVAETNVDAKLTDLLLKCMKRKIRITDFNRFVESVAGKIPIESINAGWFFEELSSIDKRYYWYVKRSLDIFYSLIGICLTLPFLPLIALLIKIDSRGPVFYSQTRVGRDNRLFRVWKLRTMVQNADEGNIHWTTDNDSRITRMGKFLRKMRIDELPQLFNILKGEMTLIGPRPEAESLVEMYRRDIPYYLERHMVTPGITGWAQINYPYGNSVEDTREKLKYDYYYIKNRGIVLDMIIFLRTIKIVLTGKGAL